jgi:phage baseplate assembly protein W
MSNIAFPYQIGAGGRTATVTADEHVRDLIEQLLFTAAGERVNRPALGTALQQLVFAPNSPEIAAATQFLVQGAVQQYLGDLIVVERVDVASQDATLTVTITYVVRRTQERGAATFVNGSAT